MNICSITQVKDFADAAAIFNKIGIESITFIQIIKTLFFDGLRNAVEENGGKIVFEDTYVLYLTRKPQNKNSLRR